MKWNTPNIVFIIFTKAGGMYAKFVDIDGNEFLLKG
jgi:hypothetical protein